MAQQQQQPNRRFNSIEIEPAVLEVPARTIPPIMRQEQLLLDKRWLDLPAEGLEEDVERWDGMS
jgi:hypothetical protein